MTRLVQGRLNLTIARWMIAAMLVGSMVPGAVGQGGMSAEAADTQATRANTRLPAFDVVSVKASRSSTGNSYTRLLPDGMQFENVPLPEMIRLAYGLDYKEQIVNAPAWIESDRFDIQAKVDGSDVEVFHKLTVEQMRQMLQPILVGRFRLSAQRQTRDMPVYALVLAKSGSKLTVSKPNDDPHSGSWSAGPDKIEISGLPVAALVLALSQHLSRTVVDKTELNGKYDLALHWAAEDGASAGINGPTGTSPQSDASGPSIFTAIQQQLGLKLESTKGPVDVIVIDHVERPSQN